MDNHENYEIIKSGIRDLHFLGVPDLDPNPEPDPRCFGLPDPDPDPLVRGMDPDPSIIMQK